METNFLENLGLSKNEAKTYLTLLRLGNANSAELARESGIHRINVYDVLNSLISKGLVSYITEGGTRVFKPESPMKLKETEDAKMLSLDKELPGLLEQFSSKKEPWDVAILRGVEGKKTQFEEITRIARNTQNRVFIPHGLISIYRPPYNTMLRRWFERLAKQKVESKLLILDTPKARERAKMFKGIERHSIRFSKHISFAPFSWDVCQYLVFLTLHIEPYLVIRIKSKEIAKAFINSFEVMWKTATK
jgi:sugar-specific transcriptional regulator TrmB